MLKCYFFLFFLRLTISIFIEIWHSLNLHFPSWIWFLFVNFVFPMDFHNCLGQKTKLDHESWLHFNRMLTAYSCIYKIKKYIKIIICWEKLCLYKSCKDNSKQFLLHINILVTRSVNFTPFSIKGPQIFLGRRIMLVKSKA